MEYTVLLTEGAERDLEEIHAYLTTFESPQAADRLLDEVLDLAESFARLPERASHPSELLAVGIQDYRQVLLGPYRVIYRILGESVFIHVIADGRRDVQSLLGRRLLRA